MINAFGGILEKYGEDTQIICGDTSVTAKTFIQPVIRRGLKENEIITPIGKVNPADYYWFAPGDLALDTEKEITVAADGTVYELIRAEKFKARGKVSHWEGVLKARRRSGNDRV